MGAGRVATRKIDGLFHAGATVTVIAPDVDAAVAGLAERDQIRLERRRYASGEAAGYRLVITATGVPEVDAAVAADADAAGVWVNSADDPRNCTFQLPAVHREGPVMVTVATGGASPALASWLRDEIALRCGGGLEELAALLSAARERVKASGRSTESIDWRALLDGPFPTHVRTGQRAEADRLLAATISREDS